MISAIGYIMAAGATALAIAFAKIDANPSLFVTDLVTSERQKTEYFEHKTMWITGASSGIGAQMAMELSKYGANLILTARSEEKLNGVAQDCRKVSDKKNVISVLPFDLTSSEELELAMDKVMEIIGNRNLDFVVMNAGKGQLKLETQMTRRETEELFQLNAISPIALTQLLLRKEILRADRGKNILVTSSVGGKYGLPLSASYAASKHALHGYFDSLKAECPWLRIDLVCPGPIDTAFHYSKEGQENAKKKKSGVREMKMPAARCAQLMVSSLLVKGGGEHFIAEQPSLIGLYIKQLFPGLFQAMLGKVASLRIEAWKEGLNLYDPQTWNDVRKRK